MQATASGAAGRPAIRRGRPKDPELRRRVLAATRALLAEVGYGELTINEIARRADVSRPTVYRSWESKAAIVHAAVFEHLPPVPDVDTGRLADDLRFLIRYLVDALSRPEMLSYFRATSAQRPDSSDFARVSNERFRIACDQYARTLKRASDRREIPVVTDHETIFWAIYGGVQTWLLLGPPVSRDELEDRFLAAALALAGARPAVGDAGHA